MSFPSLCELTEYDSIQVSYLNEQCILVDEHDNVLGPISKYDAHHDQGKLHRAFSVFIFNEKNELLLQRRSSSKITFPLLKTNSCCSHPHYNALEIDQHTGIKVAAQRKLYHELGLSPEIYSIDDIKLVHKIQYVASSCTFWSENEIDYILMLLLESPILNINANEVDMVEWVSYSCLTGMFAADSSQFTPWFKLIFNSGLLLQWWSGDSKDNYPQSVSTMPIQILSEK